MILHSFEHIPKSPAMLAQEAGRRIMSTVVNNIILGKSATQLSVDRMAMACGRGEYMVRHTPEFKAARWLAA